MKVFKINAGTITDFYGATSQEEALEMYAKEAGYKSYRDLVSQHGEVDSIEEIN